MVGYNKVNVKLLDSQLNNLKTAVKKQTGVTLGMNIKAFDENRLQDKKKLRCLKLKYLKQLNLHDL